MGEFLFANKKTFTDEYLRKGNWVVHSRLCLWPFGGLWEADGKYSEHILNRVAIGSNTYPSSEFVYSSTDSKDSKAFLEAINFHELQQRVRWKNSQQLCDVDPLIRTNCPQMDVYIVTAVGCATVVWNGIGNVLQNHILSTVYSYLVYYDFKFTTTSFSWLCVGAFPPLFSFWLTFPVMG